MPEQAKEHLTRIRVRYAETDQMGVVYHANYLVWMEVARVEFCTAMGFRYRDMERESGILLVVVEANLRYLRPARFDDEVLVRATVMNANTRMVAFAYTMHRAEDNHLLLTGNTKHLCIGNDSRAVRLPEKYRAMFTIGG